MTGSTYIDYDLALNKGLSLIDGSVNPTFGLLIVAGINLGLRIGDLIAVTYDQLKSDEFTIKEAKTGKLRTLQVNKALRSAVDRMSDLVSYELGGLAFTSQKGTTYSSQHVNILIKKYFDSKKYSSHSLRKSFGRRVWEANGETEKALLYLSEIFNHSSVSVTRKYLGIRAEEIKDIYLNM